MENQEKEDIKILFSQLLKELRSTQKISQEKLALEAGLDRTYISLLERKLRNPTVQVLFAIAKALKIKPSEIVKQIEDKKSPSN
ncbi:MAG: helix-turn-helix transcriptional regulator [Candidatus Margulisiibacteriota bacterium]|jgi:transcriptional regulator with XRE-family HTH domain